MTDKEMLELAAKAAGIDYHIDTLDGCEKLVSSGFVWNPLFDDGQALRLAVKMKIDIKHYDDYVVGWFDGGYIGTGKIMYEGHPCAATRRAIVRAAAEIGKATT